MEETIQISEKLVFIILCIEFIWLTYLYFRLRKRAHRWKLIKRKYQRLDEQLQKEYGNKIENLFNKEDSDFHNKMKKQEEIKSSYILYRIYENPQELIDGYWYRCLTKEEAEEQWNEDADTLACSLLKWNKDLQRFYQETEISVKRKSFYVGDTDTTKTISQTDYNNPYKFEDMFLVTDVNQCTDCYADENINNLSLLPIKNLKIKG